MNKSFNRSFVKITISINHVSERKHCLLLINVTVWAEYKAATVSLRMTRFFASVFAVTYVFSMILVFCATSGFHDLGISILCLPYRMMF